MNSNITPGHVMAFQAVTTGNFGSPSLWGCRINGEPGACIVLADRQEDGRIGIAPLFVTIPPGMCLELDGEISKAGSGGGPKDEKEEEWEPDPPFENEIERHFWLSARTTTGPAPR